MRFKIIMKVEGKSNEMPINYQYEMMSAIYSIFRKADEDYANMLHKDGYLSTNKRFKLFCFSNLIAPNRGICYNKETGRLKLRGEYVYWQISFMLDDGYRKFVQGVFENETIRIADNLGGVTFRIVEMQKIPDVEWKQMIECRTLSPICVSKKCDGKSTVSYLSPFDEEYEKALLTGLLERYKAIYGKEFDGERYCRLTVLGEEPKSKLITIKAATEQQTKVKGYVYRFNIELPQELFKIAYNSGLGEKCGMGFGMIN
ncbi:MAG: CRISPR-associated endoribonuclease Cas6 [Paludibacteraceae bacterium]|nr:CRISPR-associated endoribonuclease Cas6 [Paludibacteraceae bacterium]